jgi:hypothetical protein
MSRDGHTQIGHNDSEHEHCPVCRAVARLEYLGAVIGDDAYACTFQTMGQYRTELIKFAGQLVKELGIDR